MIVCTPETKCDPHRSGEIGTDDKCPGLCDAAGCTSEVVTDHYCAPHQVLADAGAGPYEMFEADKKANTYGVTLAKLMREGLAMIPVDPGA